LRASHPRVSFRAPEYDQFSLEMQRELSRDIVLRVGYVGTKGTHLLQTLDGNPFLAGPTATATCVPNVNTNPINTCRVDPTRGVIRLRSNAASSIYHSLQVSLEKRLTRNFSAGLHYTYSTFIDTASEIFNPSTGSVAVAQDSFNLRNDRGRSVYDRPQRLTGNAVYQLPFFQEQKGFLGHALGGFQLNGFFTLQSGAPFTPLNGADPARALSGIDGLVGNAVRPNLNSTLDLSSMNVIDLRAAGGAMFTMSALAVERLQRRTLRHSARANERTHSPIAARPGGKQIPQGQRRRREALLVNATRTACGSRGRVRRHVL